MEVREEDARSALEFLQNEYIQTTGLESYNLDTVDAVFDDSAVTVTCPACAATFVPAGDPVCPECGLRFG